MNDTALLGPWVRRFLLEHLIVERNLSPARRSLATAIRYVSCYLSSLVSVINPLTD